MKLRALINLLKLAAAGAVIFGIGFAFVAQDPSTSSVGPAPATADIADFTNVPVASEHKFAAAVVSMGMEPRPFDHNGNVLFFASGSYEMKPAEFLRMSQKHLVHMGVNEKDHSDLVPVRQQALKIDWLGAGDDRVKQKKDWAKLVPAAHSMMTGDVVPTEVRADYVEMVGFDVKGGYERQEDIERLIDPADRSGKTVRNLMGGYRYLDAHWEPGTGRSTVTAVWTAEGFSGDRMQGEGAQSPPDPTVPACMGCDRKHRVQSLDKREPFQSNMYTTNVGVTSTYDFYKSAMLNRGWTERGVQPTMNKLGELLPDVADLNEMGRILSLEKGDESIQLAILPGDNQTQVITLHETAGAQNDLPQDKRRR